MNVQIPWGFWAQSWEFSYLRFPYTMFTNKFQTIFAFAPGEGGVNQLVEVTVNSKKENTYDFCSSYIQAFGLCSRAGKLCKLSACSFCRIDQIGVHACSYLRLSGGVHRLNMELYLQILFGLHVYSCTHWLTPRNPHLPPSPRIWAQIRGGVGPISQPR